jgi:hypothetical protein
MCHERGKKNPDRTTKNSNVKPALPGGGASRKDQKIK